MPSSPKLTQIASSVPSLTDATAVDLLRIGQTFLEASVTADRQQDALAAIVRTVHQLAGAVVVAYSRLEQSGQLVLRARIVPNWPRDQLEALLPTIQKCAEVASARGTAQIKILDDEHNLVALSVPVSVGAGRCRLGAD